MSKAKVIFGIRDLPRPREWGFLFCKLFPDYSELILINMNLYKAEPAELKDLFTKGLNKLMQHDKFKENYTLAQLLEYDTENMEKWAIEILDDVIKTLNRKP